MVYSRTLAYATHSPTRARVHVNASVGGGVADSLSAVLIAGGLALLFVDPLPAPSVCCATLPLKNTPKHQRGYIHLDKKPQTFPPHRATSRHGCCDPSKLVKRCGWLQGGATLLPFPRLPAVTPTGIPRTLLSHLASKPSLTSSTDLSVGAVR